VLPVTCLSLLSSATARDGAGNLGAKDRIASTKLATNLFLFSVVLRTRLSDSLLPLERLLLISKAGLVSPARGCPGGGRKLGWEKSGLDRTGWFDHHGCSDGGHGSSTSDRADKTLVSPPGAHQK
jgi:hypothetical protein